MQYHRAMHRRRWVGVLAAIGLFAGLLWLWPERSPPPSPPEPTAQLPAQTRVPLAPGDEWLPEPSETGPSLVVLDGLSQLGDVGLNCLVSASRQQLDLEPLPPANGSLGDLLGSDLLHRTRDALVPSREVRRRFEDWGLGPAWVGQQLQDVSPWLALVALDAERSWNVERYSERSEAFAETYGFSAYSPEGVALRNSDARAEEVLVRRDRRAELDLAIQLAGGDAVGQRALIYVGAAARDGTDTWEAGRETMSAAALELIHSADDPELLRMAAAQLHGSALRVTPADEARILEVMEVVPPEVGRPLALRMLRNAWDDGDTQRALGMWDHYQPLIDHCNALPEGTSDSDASIACGCVKSLEEGHRSTFLHFGFIEPVDLKDRLNLAATRCVAAGHRPSAGVVPADSPMGRCVQAELGASVVLGVDVDVAYAWSRY
jgi:hypothetical protein